MPTTFTLLLAIGFSAIVLMYVLMPSKPKLNLPEGTSVTCNDGTGMVYRYTDGQLRYYPSPPIAASWNPDWANVTQLTPDTCSQIPKGAPMEMRT